jgi:sulfur relay (sulfurtransferase) complex TusBCD TusD component (DsrE family)
MAKNDPEYDVVFLFTRYGLGQGSAALQKTLVTKFFGLLLESGQLPTKILFYTDGVKLACKGSPVLDELHKLEEAGVELVLCKTCLDYFELVDHVGVGVIGGMGDILEALQKTAKVVSL